MTSRPDVALYLFQCGTLTNPKARDGLHEMPVPWYLIVHPEGHVVIDGGNPPQIAADPRSHWGALCDVTWPTMSPEEACVAQLARIGVDTSDVRWIVQTHLHLDHTGALVAIDDFPNARVLVSRAEYEYANAPDSSNPCYISADFTRPGLPWAFLEQSEDGYDLYGDGVIRLWQTPGHASGHLSVEVTLPDSGTVLLVADAAHTRAQWEGRALTPLAVSNSDAIRSVHKLHRLARRSDATVIFGHDMREWSRYRHAPEYYA